MILAAIPHILAAFGAGLALASLAHDATRLDRFADLRAQLRSF